MIGQGSDDDFDPHEVTQTLHVPDLSVPGDRALPTHFRVYLEQLDGDKVARRIPLPKVRSVLGRLGGDADIKLDDPLMSRKHAAIEVLGSAFIQLWDLASRNGTFVNDARITSLRKLAAGDVIGLGATKLRVAVVLGPG